MNNWTAALSWWLIIQLLGLTAMPLAFRLFRWLPDRGYTFSKPLGVLLVSFLFWLLNSLGFVHNSVGGILFAAGIVALLSLWAHGRKRAGSADDLDLRDWLRKRIRLVLTAELLFAITFALWATVRAHNPEITGTEKPMDLAFINAVSRSDHFPSLDPWLSGFAISYYYFGYLITATIAKLAGVSGSVAFNLGLAWLFAGTLLGGFGLVFNLVTVNQRVAVNQQVAANQQDARKLSQALRFGLLGSVLVGVMGNLEGFLELLHVNNFLPAKFWQWLNILDINTPPPASPAWPPRPNWWWWRASRVIHDQDLFGNHMEVIDEFPFFSFLLGDMHPHVLALPFVLLALALALNWWLKPWRPDAGSDGTLLAWVRGFVREADPLFLSIYAVCLGALGFLNTWDFPFYLFVTVGALALAQFRARRQIDSGFVVEASLLGIATLTSTAIFIRNALGEEPLAVGWLMIALVLSLLTVSVARIAFRRWQETGRWALGLVGQIILIGGGLLLAGLITYLPFYIGFRSQAGGILPNIINPSRLSQFAVMFGPFLFILLLWMSNLAHRTQILFKTFLGVAGGLLIVLLLATLLIAVAAIAAPQAQGWVAQIVEQAGGVGAALDRVLVLRANNSWTALLLLSMIGAVVALWQSHSRDPLPSDRSPVTPFVLLLVLTATLLTLAPEFVYLKDNFGTRMNTIFKFYYQAWVMFAVASSYALYVLLQQRGWVRWVAGVGAILLITAGIVYPILSIPTRTDNFTREGTLDGMAYMERSHPADYAAIRWLQENVSGTPVILEAVGGQYSWGGRIAAHTGLPTVLGWAGHEYQWRGPTIEPAIREPDIEKLYTSPVWHETRTLLDKYRIEYVVVGPLELSTYGQSAFVKFDRALETVFQADGVKIYRWNSLIE